MLFFPEGGVLWNLPYLPTVIVSQTALANWIHVEIFNMFDLCRRLTVMESVIESAKSGLDLADSNANSNTDPAKAGVWVWDFIHNCLTL